MTPPDAAFGFGKFIEAAKDLPAWLFTALAVATSLLRFVPAVSKNLPAAFAPWLLVGAVLFGVLACFKWINVLVELGRSAHLSAKARKTFFTGDMLEIIERSVNASQDFTFRISNKLAAIRALRLLEPASSLAQSSLPAAE